MAAQKLVETEQPIVEIAYEAHYDSQQAFTLAFRQLYECTPNIYRKNGVFYPKQSKMCMMGSVNGCSFMYSFILFNDFACRKTRLHNAAGSIA